MCLAFHFSVSRRMVSATKRKAMLHAWLMSGYRAMISSGVMSRSAADWAYSNTAPSSIPFWSAGSTRMLGYMSKYSTKLFFCSSAKAINSLPISPARSGILHAGMQH